MYAIIKPDIHKWSFQAVFGVFRSPAHPDKWPVFRGNLIKQGIYKEQHIEEDELILRLKKRDKWAYGYLYDHYSGALFGVIMRITGRREFAEEVLQDAFMKYWDRIEQYDPSKGRLFTWLLNIAKNLAIDKTRSKEFRQNQKTGEMENHVHSIGGGLVTEQQTDAIGIENLVGQLDENQRIVVDYLYFRGFTQSELAKELDIPLGTIKTRLRAAMMELRKKLNIR